MGEEYPAEHRHLKRKAAVKLLAPELVGRPDLLERFFLEARATSAIAHPGIVQVFDCELDATGRPYTVMEFLEGETLAAVLARRGALPGLMAARLARGMAEALEAAHAKGIVHRDLKPENIFVQAQPPDSVKLVDFGIAKLAGDFRAGQVHQTRSGAMMGTPLYMSPEQCRDSANIDSRTDLYSLGCVLFEMLTGHPPFTHATLGDLVVAHMTEAPPDALVVNPSVPPALAALTAELLRKNPGERPPGMRAVAERLATFLGGLTTVPDAPARTPVATHPPTKDKTKAKTTFGDSAAELVVEDGGAPPRQRRSLTLVVAALLGLGAGGVAVSRLRAQHTNAAPSLAAGESSPPPSPAPSAVAPPPAVVTPPSSAASAPPAAPPSAAPVGGVASAASAREAASAKKKGHHHGVEVALAAGTPPTEPPAAMPSTSEATSDAPGSVDYSGTWEGPWTDNERHQNGRLYLQVTSGGAANGWLSNATAGRSYRLTGRAERPGEYALVCQCPVNQGFNVRVALHQMDGSELKGRVSLSAAAGVFGQSHVVLRRSAAR